MLDFIKNLFGGSEEDESAKINEIADRIERFQDRFENSDDEENAKLAHNYSERARKMKTVEDAERVEKEFYEMLKKKGINLTSKGSGGSGGRTTYYNTTNRMYDNDDTIGTAYTASRILRDDNQNIQPEDSIQPSDGEFGGGGASESYSDNSWYFYWDYYINFIVWVVDLLWN